MKKDLLNGYSSIFGVSVQNPENFGVIEFDENKNVINILNKIKKHIKILPILLF